MVPNNQATESNKQANISSSNLNNNININNNNNKQQSASIQQNTTSTTTSTSEIKESNFNEYDDNEWDVGIGDLIIDLDADIEKSSSINNQQPVSSTTSTLTTTTATTTSSLATTNVNSTTSSSSSNIIENNKSVNSNKSKISTLLSSTGAPPTSTTATTTSSKLNKSPVTTSDNKLISGVNKTPVNLSSVTPTVTSPIIGKQFPPIGGSVAAATTNNIVASSTIPSNIVNVAHKLASQQPKLNSSSSKIQQSALLAQLNNSKQQQLLVGGGGGGSSGVDKQSVNPISVSLLQDTKIEGIVQNPNLIAKMSSTTSASGGKSATKLAVDHQATLDKGLKMKIKRTKPGTKTSEAKHEIVKAELNGTATSVNDDNNSNTSINNTNKKHSQINASPAVTTGTTTMPQGTKRGSSGHRREKTKEKTPHSGRDKNEHLNSLTNNDRPCNCTHDIVNGGNQQPCSNLSCIRIRTATDPLAPTPLSQRLTPGQQNSR